MVTPNNIIHILLAKRKNVHNVQLLILYIILKHMTAKIFSFDANS